MEEVAEIVGVSRATIYRLIDSSSFPRPVRISARRIFWVRGEVEEWMREIEKAPRV